MRKFLTRLYCLIFLRRKHIHSIINIQNTPIEFGKDVNVKFIGSARPNFTIGEGSYINGMKVYCWDNSVSVSIGKYCCIADNVIVTAGGEHEKEWVSSYPFIKKYQMQDLYYKQKKRYKGDIIIGNDVWIANNVSILSGVKIGDGAVIGAGSNVVNDIEPYGIAVGNPAKVIKKRFDSYDIEALLKIEWWNWPLEKILHNIHIFDDVKLFIQSNQAPTK